MQSDIAVAATSVIAFKAYGPGIFVSAVRRFENQLLNSSVDLLSECVVYIPVVRYAPRILAREHPDGAAARADGLFAIDGSDYEYFRWVFLHEIGHHACRGTRRWAGEEAADEFARKTLGRIVRDP